MILWRYTLEPIQACPLKEGQGSREHRSTYIHLLHRQPTGIEMRLTYFQYVVLPIHCNQCMQDPNRHLGSCLSPSLIFSQGLSQNFSQVSSGLERTSDFGSLVKRNIGMPPSLISCSDGRCHNSISISNPRLTNGLKIEICILMSLSCRAQGHTGHASLIADPRVWETVSTLLR